MFLTSMTVSCEADADAVLPGRLGLRQDALRAVLLELERCSWASDVQPILHARVPIVKFVAAVGDQGSQAVPVDLSFNYSGLYKSHALRQVARLEPRCGAHLPNWRSPSRVNHGALLATHAPAPCALRCRVLARNETRMVTALQHHARARTSPLFAGGRNSVPPNMSHSHL